MLGVCGAGAALLINSTVGRCTSGMLALAGAEFDGLYIRHLHILVTLCSRTCKLHQHADILGACLLAFIKHSFKAIQSSEGHRGQQHNLPGLDLLLEFLLAFKFMR